MYTEINLDLFIEETGILDYKTIAELIGVSLDTVRSWGCGRRHPSYKHRRKMANVAAQIRTR